MTSGDFDFFAAPTTPPPSAPPSSDPSVNRFGTPAGMNQFGTPAPAHQLGLPAAAPTAVLREPAEDEKARNLWLIAGGVAGLVLLTGGIVYLQHLGDKTATKVVKTVETPIVKAHQIAETSDLQQADQAEESYLAQNSTYAASISQLPGFVASPTDTVTVVSATATTFCLRADDLSEFHAPSLYLSSASSVASTTPCT